MSAITRVNADVLRHGTAKARDLRLSGVPTLPYIHFPIHVGYDVVFKNLGRRGSTPPESSPVSTCRPVHRPRRRD
ncbi:hypothetical protein, partial [Phytoactinopolyspora endophytica]|uniref:hypothetical protein n=1 Tax=Phytoactinopolyspora endophytica TaxID=1642495 RepID=UPI00197C1A61